MALVGRVVEDLVTGISPMLNGQRRRRRTRTVTAADRRGCPHEDSNRTHAESSSGTVDMLHTFSPYWIVF